MYSEETKISLDEVGKLIRDSPDGHTNWEWVGETNNGDVFWNKVTGEILFEDRNNYLIRRKV